MGPDDRDSVSTGELADLFCESWGEGMSWVNRYDGGPHEANFLKLDCSKLKAVFGWKPVWDVRTAVEKTVEWSKAWMNGNDMELIMEKQILEYRDEREKEY